VELGIGLLFPSNINLSAANAPRPPGKSYWNFLDHYFWSGHDWQSPGLSNCPNLAIFMKVTLNYRPNIKKPFFPHFGKTKEFLLTKVVKHYYLECVRWIFVISKRHGKKWVFYVVKMT
jgi:hypothetical protein